MAKIAIITDTHFGSRNDNPKIVDHQERFFKEAFFPYLDKNKIKIVLNLGDTYDKRKAITATTLSKSRRFFFEGIKKRGIEYHAILGNHDCFYKSTNAVNFPSMLDSEYGDIIEHEPKILEYDGLRIGMVPWIAKDNYDKCVDFLKETDVPMIFGHFDIQGFQMYKGSISHHGFKPSMFSRFEMVLSGHYHHKSSSDNIHYLGSPYQMNWADHGDERGFHVIDTETREIEFVKNPFTLFQIIEYDDEGLSADDVNEIDVSALEGSFVKVIVKNKMNPVLLESLSEKLTNSNIADVKIDEVSQVVNTEIDMGDIEDILDLLDAHVDSLETDHKDNIKNYIRTLHRKAMS